MATAALIGPVCSIGLLLIVGDPGNQLHLSLLLVWLCIPPAILAVRQTVRRLLASLDLLQVRSLVASDPAHIAEALKALTADASLGYRHVGSIGLDTLAAVGVRAALEHANAEFLVLAPDGGTDLSLQTINAELALQGVPFAVALTQSAGAPVACPQSHYALNCNLMLVTRGNRLNHPTARLSKATVDIPAGVGHAGAGGAGPGGDHAPGAGRRRAGVLPPPGSAPMDEASPASSSAPWGWCRYDLQHLLAADPAAAAEWRANQKLANDPRITKIGRLPATIQPGRAAAAHQRAARRDEPGRTAADRGGGNRAVRRQSNTTTASSRASPDSGRSAAAAAPAMRSASNSTSGTSRTGRWATTSRSWRAPSSRC